jgi:hypothetical protein
LSDKIEHDDPVNDVYTGFMCKVDFEHELYFAYGGNKVYPTVEELIEAKPCVDHCGIVQVKVELVKVLRPSFFDEPEFKDRKELVE